MISSSLLGSLEMDAPGHAGWEGVSLSMGGGIESNERDPSLVVLGNPDAVFVIRFCTGMKDMKWSGSQWSVPMEWQEWMCRDGKGLREQILKTFLRKKSSQRKKGFS